MNRLLLPLLMCLSPVALAADYGEPMPEGEATAIADAAGAKGAIRVIHRIIQHQNAQNLCGKCDGARERGASTAIADWIEVNVVRLHTLPIGDLRGNQGAFRVNQTGRRVIDIKSA